MMYSNKLVASVKSNGKFLREDHRENESTVYLPFKSEYSVFLKNLSERRALVHVDIDGKNMTEGGLIVAAGQVIDLERPANFSTGRKFKFIEKTSEISDFRGDHPEDGLIVVKWQFEKPVNIPLYRHPEWYVNIPWVQPSWTSGGGPTFTTTNTGTFSNESYTACCTSEGIRGACGPQGAQGHAGPPGFIGYAASAPQGITVEGSKSNQNFSKGYIGNLEGTLYSMVIKLYGGPRPIYVSEKIQCPTCGRKWKTSFEFCGNCGTALK